jgi:outer membrane protein OmpA-like peptidoglycan-associated protein
MKKVIICLAACFFLTANFIQAQEVASLGHHRTARHRDSSAAPVGDTTASSLAKDSSGQVTDSSARQTQDSAKHTTDTALQAKDSVTFTHLPDASTPAPPVKDTVPAVTPAQPQTSAATPAQDPPKDPQAQPDPSMDSKQPQDSTNTRPSQDSAQKIQDTAQHDSGPIKRELDTRWFISPLLKFQFQDFGMLEKNRKGYLSDANTLPIQARGNLSFAASAYKNLTSRFSVSADLGFSFGHVTSDSVLISHTASKTYNLLNATFYYHLLNASYRLQPYISLGINDIINDASYASVPIGIGAKFNAKKIMVTGQVMYGYAISKNISNTTMYSVGVYLPIKNKKWKKQQEEDNSPYNRTTKKDTVTKSGNIVNNIYITINMDSAMKAKKGKNGSDGLDADEKGDNNGSRDGDDEAAWASNKSSNGRHKKGGGIKSFNLQDFNFHDYRIDTVNGRPVVKFIIYFEFNEYSLTSHAFGNIDKVIQHLRTDRSNLLIEIKGYTDDVGTDEYNNFLSRRRAKMVYDYMNSRGVPTELMKAKAYGKDNPVADNKDPNQAWLNRRAEIIVREK